MDEPECFGLTRNQEMAIKKAAEGTCELCREYFALPFLEIHRISRRMYREMARDPASRILVVCRLCHDHIHRLPMKVRDQRAVAAGRSFFIRRDLRRILGYRPKPYSPPENLDVSQIYEEYFNFVPPGSFRLGG